MKVTKRQLRLIIREMLELDLEEGDVILTGRFKNKRTVVKKIGTDDLGQPTVNGMKALSFRIEKLMPKDQWSKKSKEEAEKKEEEDSKK
jgi:hypothetical protein